MHPYRSNALKLAVAFLLPLPFAHASFVYLTDSGVISRLNLADNSLEPIVETGFGSAAINLDVNDSMGRVFWTERVGSRIRSSRLDGSDVQDVLTGRSSPSDIEVDTVNSRMFWSEDTNADYNPDTIFMADLDGSNVRMLIRNILSAGLAYDASSNGLYWSEWSWGTDQINRINLDNFTHEVIIDNINTPLRLGIHPIDHHLYVGHSKGFEVNDEIWTSTLSGDNRSLFATLPTDRMDGITFNPQTGAIYWTDLYAGTLHSIDADGSNVLNLTRGLGSPTTIAFSAVPEPRMYALALGVIAGLVLIRRRWRKAQ